MRALLLHFLLVLSFASVSYAQTNKLSVYFGLNKSELDKNAQRKLDSLAHTARMDTAIGLRIVAYTDFIASEEYNKKLSAERAQTVKNYLISKGMPEKRIFSSEGKGELPATAEVSPDGGVPSDRRVDILIGRLKPGTIVNAPADLKPSGELSRISELKEGDKLVIDNLYFIPGRHFLRQVSYPKLAELLQVLQDNPTLKIELQGHICCTMHSGDGLDHDTQEWALSRNRAKYVYDYLVEKGIDKARLSYKGFGHSRPLVPVERTTEDQDRNRRVEIEIISK